jgi:hypothetical protein
LTKGERVSKKPVNNRSVALKVPKEIRELAEKFRQQRVEKEQAERQEKQQRDAKQKRVRANRLKNGLEYATKVFLWAKELKESDLGQELMKKLHEIFFFDDHIIGVEWVGLCISPNGLFMTQQGWRSYRHPLSSPKNLAESVPTVILKAASEWIDTGQVWNCVKRRFDYL